MFSVDQVNACMSQFILKYPFNFSVNQATRSKRDPVLIKIHLRSVFWFWFVACVFQVNMVSRSQALDLIKFVFEHLNSKSSKTTHQTIKMNLARATIALLSAVPAALSTGNDSSAASSRPLPNIVVFMVDDLGWNQVGLVTISLVVHLFPSFNRMLIITACFALVYASTVTTRMLTGIWRSRRPASTSMLLKVFKLIALMQRHVSNYLA